MASDFTAERSSEARALAEEALLRLLVALEGRHADVLVLVVLGGLVPETLTRGQAESVPMHLGTSDVDIHVSFVTEPDRDVSSLEAALDGAGFELDGTISKPINLSPSPAASARHFKSNRSWTARGCGRTLSPPSPSSSLRCDWANQT